MSFSSRCVCCAPLHSLTGEKMLKVDQFYATVSIVNALDVEVARVFEGELSAAENSFHWNVSSGLPSGLYECVLRMDGQLNRVGMIVR